MTTTTDSTVLQVHPQSRAGFSTGKGELYDKNRPSYPASVLSAIRKAVGSRESLDVVEIGSGTGIMTRALLSNPEWASSIDKFIAIEPSDGMREVFEKEVKDPRVSLHAGTFDKTGVPDGWADVIVIAQAFHWCLTHEATATEFARIVKPGGVVALVWNKHQRERAEWMEDIHKLIDEYPHRSEEEGQQWRKIFDTKEYKDAFDPPEETILPNDIALTQDKLVIGTLTLSVFAILPDEEKQKAKKKLIQIVEEGKGRVWADEERGLILVPNGTEVYLFHRK